MNQINYYRVTKSDVSDFSRYGDTIAIKQGYDTDMVYNLVTGKSYTYGGEQGTKIKDLGNFPLTGNELVNLDKFKQLGLL